MTPAPSQMRREIAEIPDAVERLLGAGQTAIAAAAVRIREADPPFIVTVARGSSDHVCTYLKYAAELSLGLPVASVGPSVASLYRAPLRAAGSLCLAVSQSGQSPDIVELTRALADSGAVTVAITNHPEAPLGRAADATLDIHAGPELSVAATKTFVTSAVAGLWLLAGLGDDAGLRAAIRTLPERLDQAARADWSAVQAAISPDRSLYALGRGPAWAISNEAALKLKETCQIHAESFSSAEVLHGPVSIVGRGFPVLALAARDAAEPALVEVADQIARTGADVFVTSPLAHDAHVLQTVRTDHWLTDPLALIVSFYGLVDEVAAGLGIDPDTPRHLKKVTQTV